MKSAGDILQRPFEMLLLTVAFRKSNLVTKPIAENDILLRATVTVALADFQTAVSICGLWLCFAKNFKTKLRIQEDSNVSAKQQFW